MKYYICAYKTGMYPQVIKDRVFLWGRLYPKNADPPAGADPVGRPANWDSVRSSSLSCSTPQPLTRASRLTQTTDTLWAVALLKSPGTVTIACGSGTTTVNAKAGITKLQLPLSTDCQVSATVVRNGATALSFTPQGFNFSTHPPTYNFNAFVAASP